MKSSHAVTAADRERTGGIYAGALGFVFVWIIAAASGIPFRQTIWKGIACAIALFLMTSFLLRIVMRVEASRPPEETKAPSKTDPGTESREPEATTGKTATAPSARPTDEGTP